MCEVVVIWEPPSITSVNPTTWHAKLVAPVKSITFAHVSRKITGQWYLAMEPRGWDGHPRWLIDYPNPHIAKKHAEAWARVNWKRIMRPEEIPFVPYVTPRKEVRPLDLQEDCLAELYGPDASLEKYVVVHGRYRRR